ncbi:MAG: cytidylate kinase-like family protein [Eubacteriales bacterium]|nr:cytidylate kinase-like family protein [Clostridia bacterium]MDY2845712.1 cytidylate kinase-like family protein [Eubacteriales bacterium]
MKNYIVTIAREYGSGGRECGKKLAELTGYKFYDKDLITLAAQKSGMSTDALNSVDEKAASSLLYTLALGSSIYNSGMGSVNLPINDKLFVVQSQIIKDIANSGEGAIIVGRCADYVLSERDNVVKVYITSDFDTRVNTVMKRHDLTQSQARDLIIKTDKRRSNYYSYYTGEKWGKADKYDVVVSTARIGIDGAAGLIADYIKMLG